MIINTHWNGFGRKGVWPNVTRHPAGFYERLRKTRICVEKFGVSKEIRKKHLSNADPECCEENYFYGEK
jgi:hypothetical protein